MFIRYEKLQRWDDALKAYTAKAIQASSPHLVLEATLGINFSMITCLTIGYILISFNACMLLITIFFKMKESSYLNFSKRIQIKIAAGLSN